jgi:probable HAF family extracellular repeat protein
VGLIGSGPGAKGFLISAGSYSQIQFPNSSFTEAWGVNDLGDIVGQVDIPQSPIRGFRRSGDNYSMIDLPDSSYSWEGRGINDLGQIVGSFTDNNGRTHGYSATPTALRTGPSDPGAVPHLTNSLGVSGPAGPQGPQGLPGPQGPPGPAATTGPRDTAPSKTASALNATRDALHRASGTLQRAANQTCYVTKAVDEIKVALNDATAAVLYIDHPNAAPESPRPSAIRSDFTAPAGSAPGRNAMLEAALGLLKIAFDTLAQSTGDDPGSFRARTGNDIASAANDVISAINAQPCPSASR